MHKTCSWSSALTSTCPTYEVIQGSVINRFITETTWWQHKPSELRREPVIDEFTLSGWSIAHRCSLRDNPFLLQTGRMFLINSYSPQSHLYSVLSSLRFPCGCVHGGHGVQFFCSFSVSPILMQFCVWGHATLYEQHCGDGSVGSVACGCLATK
jgi:hypothetical protein